MDLMNRSSWSGTRIREKILNDQDWEKDVPWVVSELIKEIDGVQRLKDLSRSDEDSI